jgi:tRNA pseudouridine55 synthase
VIPPEGGVLLVDKPVGPTSHDIVGLARRGLKTRRVGHTGTLDPFASGLLVLCVGPATRLSSWLTHLDKVYEATVHFGVETTTLDPEGEVTARDEPGAQRLAEAQVAEILVAFEGKQQQVPPAYSAKKISGEAAHRRVRRGEVVELPPVPIEVVALQLLAWQAPRLEVRVHCSSGTYIRALARDFGKAAGCGAHLEHLRRLRVGAFAVGDAVQVDDLSTVSAGDWVSPLDALTRTGMAAIEIDDADVVRITQGQAIEVAGVAPSADAWVALGQRGQLVAIAQPDGPLLKPRKVFTAP